MASSVRYKFKSSVEELRRKGSATRQANRERWWKARVVVKHVFKHRTAVREGETKALGAASDDPSFAMIARLDEQRAAERDARAAAARKELEEFTAERAAASGDC